MEREKGGVYVGYNKRLYGNGTTVEQKDMVILLLGGKSNACWLASWLPSSFIHYTSEAIACGAFQVARFLQD